MSHYMSETFLCVENAVFAAVRLLLTPNRNIASRLAPTYLAPTLAPPPLLLAYLVRYKV